MKRDWAVFLDRDGVINEEINLLHKIEQFKMIPSSPAGIKLLNEHGIPVIVATNQPVVARNLATEEDVEKIHQHMICLLAKEGARIDSIYYCPHHPERGHPEADDPKYRRECECRKPKIGMLLSAKEKYALDLSKCFLIGDTTIDIMTGKNAGCKTILVRTGLNGSDKKFDVEPDYTFENLYEAAKFIVSNFPA